MDLRHTTSSINIDGVEFKYTLADYDFNKNLMYSEGFCSYHVKVNDASIYMIVDMENDIDEVEIKDEDTIRSMGVTVILTELSTDEYGDKLISKEEAIEMLGCSKQALDKLTSILEDESVELFSDEVDEYFESNEFIGSDLHQEIMEKYFDY